MTQGLSAVRLRPIASSDAARIHEWAADARACRYQPWGPNSRAQTDVFVAEAVDAWTVRPQQRWAWVAVDRSDLVVGNAEVNSRGHGRAEISYAVHVERWGRGVGSAIADQLTGWAFTNLPDLERLEATCDPRNTASAGVLRHVGMTYEGTLRHVRLTRGEWCDSQVFSVLKSERPTIAE